MNAERHAKVSKVFLTARDVPPDQRPQLLKDLCGDDDALRTEVEDLLSHDKTDAVVDRPVFDLDAGRKLFATQMPARIGQYEILDLLGEGGMGTVYRARQSNPNRIVALKVIRAGISSAALLHRFEHEAQVLGRLQHPGIAQIFEAGTAETQQGVQPYFAMEFVEGQSLSTYANKQGLPIRRRLELICEICDAIQHAHEKGVIHRDLKPTNIIVGENGHPKILDFGVARVTDSDLRTTTLRTNVGQLLGTIPYMSPEQVAADSSKIDARSDVYAIGVICCELLTGRLPYDLEKKSVADAARIIRDEDPLSLRSVNRTYRGDIETIVGKALEKDKDRRYASAAELAADIRRHLHDEPIVARPPTATYQMAKFVRRHRAFVGAVGIIFIVLVSALVITTRQRNEAQTARAEMLVAKEKAEREAAKTRAINDFLSTMLASANPFGATGITGRDMTMSQMLDNAAKSIDNAFPNQPEIEAAARSTIGKTYHGLGKYKEAIEQLTKALKLQEHGGDDARASAAVNMRMLATAISYSGQRDEAIKLLEQALDIQRKIYGTDNHREIAATLSDLGWLHSLKGEWKPAETHLQHALEVHTQLMGRRSELAASNMVNLAAILRAQGDINGAGKLYAEALSIFRELFGESHAYVGNVENNMARILIEQGDLDGAEAAFRRSLAILKTTVGEEHVVYANVLNNLAYLLHDRKKLEEAEAFYREAIVAMRKSVGEEHEDFARTRYNFAFLLEDLNKFEEAAEAYKATADYHRRHTGERSWRVALADAYYGQCRAKLGHFDQAEPVILHSYDLLNTESGIQDAKTQAVVRILERVYRQAGRIEEADKWLALKAK